MTSHRKFISSSPDSIRRPSINFCSPSRPFHSLLILIGRGSSQEKYIFFHSSDQSWYFDILGIYLLSFLFNAWRDPRCGRWDGHLFTCYLSPQYHKVVQNESFLVFLDFETMTLWYLVRMFGDFLCTENVWIAWNLFCTLMFWRAAVFVVICLLYIPVKHEAESLFVSWLVRLVWAREQMWLDEANHASFITIPRNVQETDNFPVMGVRHDMAIFFLALEWIIPNVENSCSSTGFCWWW